MTAAIDHLDEIQASSRRISQMSRTHDLQAPVPRLGRWKIRDVVAHLGGVHRWATRIVETTSMDGPGFTKSKLDGTALCDWFDEGAGQLLDALASIPLSTTCPNFNPGSDATVFWWARRQALETTVHRWDIERSLERITPIEPPVAADGIDEFLDVFVRTRGKQTLIAPLMLTSRQPTRSWSLTPSTRPGRIDIAAGRLADTPEELAGPPDDILLLLWGRLTLDETGVTIKGRPEVARSLTTSG